MKTSVVKIGNSKGIRLPKIILNQCQIENEVDLQLKNNFIIIKPVPSKKIRKNWAEVFKKMHSNNDDKLLIQDSLDLNMEDWEW